MEKQVKINISVDEALRADLKAIAKKKGMQFHAFIAQELLKVRNKEIGK